MPDERRAAPLRIAEVSVSAIRNNVQRIRAVTGGTIIAIVKANGYGHGAIVAARAAADAGADMLGAVDVTEALALRDAGVTMPVLCWLHGPRTDFAAAIRHDVELGVSSLEQLELIAQAADSLGQRARVQLKVDSGLSRGGAAPSGWRALFSRAAELETQQQIHVTGIFSHLANASPESDAAQARRFDAAITALQDAGVNPEMRHLAASAAVFALPGLHYNAARVGISLYGLSPLSGRTSADLGLTPALTLKSEVIAVRDVDANTGVGYDLTYTTSQPTKLGLVPLGYADGVPRALSGSGVTLMVRGQQFPIVGRVSMDQIIIELGENTSNVSVGDEVVLFGDPATGAVSVDEWARIAGTISYEIVAGIGSRVQRIAVDTAVDTAVEPI